MISFSLLLLFPRRSDGSATAHATVDVLLFLFGWFQDLRGEVGVSCLYVSFFCSFSPHFGTNGGRETEGGVIIIPGMNITSSHQHSSLLQHCRILRNS